MALENVKDSIENIKIDSTFINDIINGIYDWVRVIDRDNNIIYMNKAMREAFKNYRPGDKCYKVVCKDYPCENCISRKAVFEGETQKKEEIIGGRIFSVMSSPVKNSKGEIIAVVEVLHDITEIKNMQNKIIQQNKKLMDDLKIAKKMQCNFLPKHLPEDKIDFSFIYKPCETLGGDFLDIFKIDDDHVGLYIADVSGHGVSASMLTMFLRSTINKSMPSPAQTLKNLYTDFNRSGFDSDMYITVFYAIIDLKNRRMIFSNAGHNVPPVVFNKNRFELLRVPGIPISNWMDEPTYEDRVIDLQKGDRLFFSTDGIVEIRNKDGEQFGKERLLNILLNDDSEPSSILARIVDSAGEFSSAKSFDDICDDITMALIKIK
ncbi:SpoIIE family protein phosphatase [Pseudoclostridium thermosuccinogenes]|uniref:SpoIIE family protein phosphatase n=1 Tax=Clostridium thermosuccinogenes TaxID=84032 RepID=UPI002FD9A9AD